MSSASQTLARGGVLLLGSLLWEGQKKSDGKKGKLRKTWRSDHLDMNETFTVRNLPLRYGRRSNSRNGQFTMILRPYQRCGRGAAKAASFKRMFEMTADESLSEKAGNLLRAEIEALARVEGIWTGTNLSHISTDDKDDRGNPLHGKPWGLVAMWINPNTRAGQAMAAHWRTNFALRETICARPFGNLVNRYGLITLPWPNEDLSEFDFCLCTPTRLNVTNWSHKRAVDAISLGEYFDRTQAAKIVTGDDLQLSKIRADEEGRVSKKVKHGQSVSLAILT